MATTLDILIARPAHPAGLEALRSIPGVSATVIAPIGQDAAAPDEALRDQRVLFTCFLPSNLDRLRRLEFVQIDSVGFDHILAGDLPRRGARVCNALGIFDAPIAEWNLAMMVNLARDLRGMIRNQERGAWDRDVRFQREIRGLTVGIWGYGGIGRETARLAKALGMTVRVLTRRPVGPRTDIWRLPGCGDPDGTLPDRAYSLAQKAEFLAGLDFLVLAMPETGNRGLIGEDELRALPRHACLLNPARGPLVREEALLRALREGWIAAAALDTHYQYPLPADHPLWSLPNVIMTPHISGSNGSPHTDERIWDIFVQNVRRFRDGAPLLNIIDADKLRPPARAASA